MMTFRVLRRRVNTTCVVPFLPSYFLFFSSSDRSTSISHYFIVGIIKYVRECGGRLCREGELVGGHDIMEEMHESGDLKSLFTSE